MQFMLGTVVSVAAGGTLAGAPASTASSRLHDNVAMALGCCWMNAIHQIGLRCILFFFSHLI